MGAMLKFTRPYVHAPCDPNDGGGGHHRASRITTLLDPHKYLSFCALSLQASNERIPFFFWGGTLTIPLEVLLLFMHVFMTKK